MDDPAGLNQFYSDATAINGPKALPFILSLPKTPSALPYNDLRHLGELGPYIRITDFSNKARSEAGGSAAGVARLRRQPFAHTAGEPHPEDAVAQTQLRTFDGLSADRQLLLQGQVLNGQVGPWE